jgi:hypothetical protein
LAEDETELKTGDRRLQGGAKGSAARLRAPRNGVEALKYFRSGTADLLLV